MIFHLNSDREKIYDVLDTIWWENKRLVFTNGCFDILHAGHVSHLIETKKLGDILIVGMNSDISVKALKGDERPINNEDDRALVLSSIGVVDHVIIFDESSVLNLIKILRPSIITKGGDYTYEQLSEDEKLINEIGGKLVIIPITKDISTTKIINKIK